jgi:AcrR family transcriptional regulator
MGGEQAEVARSRGRGTPARGRLKPGPSRDAAAAAAHQRARLHAAMVDACAGHGYAETTVRELVTLAGTSTKTLYRHFESKDACFLATYEVVAREASERISAAFRGAAPGGGADRSGGLCRAFDAFAAELIERPGPSRLALIEILTAAPEAPASIERTEGLFVEMISQSLRREADEAPVPTGMVRALIGGIWFLAGTRLLEGRQAEIATAGGELGDWLLAYRSPATHLVPAGRAPIEPPQRGGRRRGPVPERVRMLHAAADLVGRGGFEALSPGQISGAAEVSVDRFEEEFEDLAACFFAMLELLSADALAEALRQSEGAGSWADGVYRAVTSLFCRLGSDPALARAAFVDAFVIGPDGAMRRAAIMRGFAGILIRRSSAANRPSPLVAEAIVGAVWSIAHRQVLRGRRDLLPASSARAAFVVLAPIVGAERALATVLG